MAELRIPGAVMTDHAVGADAVQDEVTFSGPPVFPRARLATLSSAANAAVLALKTAVASSFKASRLECPHAQVLG